MSLFQLGAHLLHGGDASPWKIECDTLTDQDWACLAVMAAVGLPLYGSVEGVPTGGLKLAEALRKFVTPGCDRILIADDVLTTGGSMEEQRAGRDAVGVVAFARGECPHWVVPVFVLNPAMR